LDLPSQQLHTRHHRCFEAIKLSGQIAQQNKLKKGKPTKKKKKKKKMDKRGKEDIFHNSTWQRQSLVAAHLRYSSNSTENKQTKNSANNKKKDNKKKKTKSRKRAFLIAIWFTGQYKLNHSDYTWKTEPGKLAEMKTNKQKTLRLPGWQTKQSQKLFLYVRFFYLQTPVLIFFFFFIVLLFSCSFLDIYHRTSRWWRQLVV
jgi:hypothetical protein